MDVRARRFVALVLVGGLTLAACGNSDDDDAADTPATTVAAEVTEPETTEPDHPSTTAPAATEPATTGPGTTEPATSEPTIEPTGTTEPAGEEDPELGEFQPISGVPGVTDEEIQFAVLATGPSNPLGTCLLECYVGGVQAYFDWRNELGGVHGRQLTITHEVDDEMGAGQLKMLELIEAADVFGIVYSPIILGPGFAEANQAGVPLFSTVQAGPPGAGLDNVFKPGTAFCADCPRKATVHPATLVGATKVGVLALGASQASKDCAALAAETFELWGPELGIEVVYVNDTLPFGLPNGVAPEVTAMKNAGVDYVQTCIDQNGVLTIEQELHRQGMADVTVVIPQGYSDAEWLAANADLLEGDIFASVFFRPFEADISGTRVEALLETFEAGGYYLSDIAVQGWIAADMAVTGILAAGPQFDRASTIAALNAMTDYDAGGVLPSFDLSKSHLALTAETSLTDAPPIECLAVVRVEGGEFVPMADPATPFFAYDRTSLEWSEPEQSAC